MRRALGGLAGLFLFLRCGFSWALSEADPYAKETSLLSTSELPSEAAAAEALPVGQEKPESLYQFLSQRTQIGYGGELEYNNNIFFQDNNRKSDYISTVEGVLFYNDPRGALLYGCQWEVNAFRYLRNNKNAINHDVVSYFDFDPGGRWQIHFTHYLDANNRLVFGAPGVDILRRSTDFQRTVEHRFEPRIRYALNEDDSLVGTMSYSLFDDQIQNDASTDRRLFKSSLDWNHNLNRLWGLYAGSGYEDREIPGDKLKNSTSYGGRLGTRYELSRTESFKALLQVDRPRGKDAKTTTDIGYSVSLEHALSPRTDLSFGLTSGRRTSFAAGRTDFRSRAPDFRIKYLLTPLITVEPHGQFEWQKSINTGSSANLSNKVWNLGLDLVWQVREQVKIKLFYAHRRSPTFDYTNRTIHLQLEGTF